MASPIHSLSFNGSVTSVHSAQEQISKLLKAKIGLKEVVDAGITQVPDIFIFPKEHQVKSPTPTGDDGRLEVPVIDLHGLHGDRRREIVTQIRRSAEKWGIFQLLNHAVPHDIIKSLLESLQEFNEQPVELKADFYSTDSSAKKISYGLAVHPFCNKVAMWKDMLVCAFEDLSTLEIEALPPILRKPMSDYVKSVTELKDRLSELLSEALGLRSDHLKMMRCMEATRVASHYSPACPEPTLAMATREHTDLYFLTLLVQNHIDGLQVKYENQWVDVNVKEGAIIVNIGDMLQLISNGIFKSVIHRSVATRIGPRVSTACFFLPGGKDKEEAYGPIKELLEPGNAPLYKETSVSEYVKCFFDAIGKDPVSNLLVQRRR